MVSGEDLPFIHQISLWFPYVFPGAKDSQKVPEAACPVAPEAAASAPPPGPKGPKPPAGGMWTDGEVLKLFSMDWFKGKSYRKP